MWLSPVQPFEIRLDLGVMAMKGYCLFPIDRTSPSDSLVPYPGHAMGESYSSAEMHSMYSTASADWANPRNEIKSYHTHMIIQSALKVLMRCG